MDDNKPEMIFGDASFVDTDDGKMIEAEQWRRDNPGKELEIVIQYPICVLRPKKDKPDVK